MKSNIIAIILLAVSIIGWFSCINSVIYNTDVLETQGIALVSIITNIILCLSLIIFNILVNYHKYTVNFKYAESGKTIAVKVTASNKEKAKLLAAESLKNDDLLNEDPATAVITGCKRGWRY